MKKLSLIALSLSLGAMSNSAVASYDNGGFENEEGLYLGASYGHLRVDGDDEFDDDKDAYEFRAGYSFNQYFAIDGSYIDFGEYGSELANADTDGFTLGLQLTLPIHESFDIFLRGGQLWYETESRIGNFVSDYDDEGMYAGVGLGYEINNDWMLTFEYNLYDVDLDVEGAVEDLDDANFSTDMKQAAVGVRYKF